MILRVDLRDVLVAHPQALDRAGAHVLDEDVAVLNYLKCDGAVGFFLEIELDVALVVVGRNMQDRGAVDSGRHSGREIVAAGPFHPDHVGAHRAQQLG